MACDNPLYIDWDHKYLPGVKKIPIGCGKCPPCIKRRIDGWVFRMLQEDRHSFTSHFVTLTYAPEYLPECEHVNEETGEVKIFPTLRKEHLQNFMKRLRKFVKSDFPELPKISYYAVGEYGSDTKRPHYHLLVFGCPSEAYYSDAWSYATKEKDRNGNYKRLQYGNVHLGFAERRSIAYTVGYMNKIKLMGTNRWPGSEYEFWCCSDHLGASYLVKSWKETEYHGIDKNGRKFKRVKREPKEYTRAYYWHRDRPNDLSLTLPGGDRIAMPEYYRRIIWNKTERLQQIPYIKDATKEKEIAFRRKCAELGLDWYTVMIGGKETRKRIFENKVKTKFRDYD